MTIDLLAVLAATVAAFLCGGAYYAVLGDRLAVNPDASAEMPPWKLAVELLRCLVLAVVVAGLASQGEIDEWTGGVALGLALWLGFPAVLLTGAVVHEGTPAGVAALHAGDWLAKLLLVAVIVTVLQ